MEDRTTLLVQIVDPRAGKNFHPKRDGDCGIDLEVWFPINGPQNQVIQPNSFAFLPTGLRVKVADNAWGCLRPRSSTFYKRRLFVMEGTIDSGYTGDLEVIVFNPTDSARLITSGEALAQIIPVPKFSQLTVHEVDKMPITERGVRGYGSTDKKPYPMGTCPDCGSRDHVEGECLL